MIEIQSVDLKYVKISTGNNYSLLLSFLLPPFHCASFVALISPSPPTLSISSTILQWPIYPRKQITAAVAEAPKCVNQYPVWLITTSTGPLRTGLPRCPEMNNTVIRVHSVRPNQWIWTLSDSRYIHTPRNRHVVGSKLVRIMFTVCSIWFGQTKPHTVGV